MVGTDSVRRVTSTTAAEVSITDRMGGPNLVYMALVEVLRKCNGKQVLLEIEESFDDKIEN